MSLEDLTKQIDGVFSGKDSGLGKKFKIDFGSDGCIFIDTTVNPNVVSNDNSDADSAMIISLENYGKLISGNLNGKMAFLTGKLKIDGDLGVAMELGTYLESQR